jgi:hypothetical protein
VTPTNSTEALIRNLAALGCILQGKDLPEPPYVNSSVWNGDVTATWYVDIDAPNDQKRHAEILIAALGGQWVATATDKSATWTQSSPGVALVVQADRAAVCERVVVGTRTVTKEVPTKVTKTVVEDIVEWRCIDPLAEMNATAVTS